MHLIKNNISPDEISSSESYSLRFSGSVGQWFLDVQAACVRTLIGKGALSVLDVGGGHGQLTECLLTQGHSVTIIGSPNAPTDRIQTFMDERKVTYVTSSLFTLPFADRTFDVVVCFRIVSHLDAWQQFCAELCRVARRIVIIDYPCSRSLNVLTPFLFRWKKGIEKDTREFTVLRRDDVRSVFAECSFKTVREIGQFFWPMVIHRAIKIVIVAKALETFAALLGLRYLFGSPIIAKFERIESRE
jgi:ubiquinone/menaquinone biosynthesis C-methylase UbiE